MKYLISAAALTAALVATPVFAADAPMVIVDDEAMDMAMSSGDWTGLYAGVGVTVGSAPSIPENFVQGDLIIGGNVQSSSFLFGAEAWLSGYASDLPAQALAVGAAGRAGFLVTPEVLIYASAGVHHFFYPGTATYGQLGAGIEFMATDNMSIDLEGKWWREVGGTLDVFSASASALWHFN